MSAHSVKVVVIDKDPGFLEEATAELSGHFAVYTTATAGEGLKLCAQLRPQVVIADSGMSDVTFTDFLSDLKGLDAGGLRIATSRDYSAIENVMQAIDTSHIHKYFRKPVNFFDLVDIINARTVSYQVGRGARGGDTGPAYKRLHTIVDKAKDVEKLKRQLELQLGKVREVESESFTKVKAAVDGAAAVRRKMAEKDALIGSLQAQSAELEQLKKRDIDRVEQEREALRLELGGLREQCERLTGENAQIGVLRSDGEKFRSEAERLRGEVGTLRVSVARERETMVAEMTKERKVFADEMARKKDEADRIIDVQRERNKAELKALQVAFDAEKQRAAQQVQQLTVELEKDRAAKLAEIEAGRKRLADEMAAIELERKRVEAELAQKKIEAERVVEAQKERNKAELQSLQTSFEAEKRRAHQEIEALQAEVDAERKARLATIEAGRKQMEEDLVRVDAESKQLEKDLAKRKGEAERAIGMQRERNKAELEALHAAFKQEQERAAWYQIEQLKAELEKDRLAKLAEIEADRKRGEQELDGIKAKMSGEKELLEKALLEQRERAEADIRRINESAEKERTKLTEALEKDLAVMKKAAENDLDQLKATATRELDRYKVQAQKRELELSEALTQASRETDAAREQFQLVERRIKSLEREVEQGATEKERAVQEVETMRADYDVIVRSREALKAELMELRENLR
ncbi:MAG: hypothetical protein WCP29_02240 [Acidobacteriota bacterium]